MSKSISSTAWRGYGLSQSQGALPVGPITIVIHMASVWVPFTSESKEALAHYPEIIKEINGIIKKEIGNIALCDDMVFVPGLPKTRSGKIMRRILRAIAKGEEITQDTSTLEDPSVVGTIESIVKSCTI